MHGCHKSSVDHVAVALMHGYAVCLVVEVNQEVPGCLVDNFKKGELNKNSRVR